MEKTLLNQLNVRRCILLAVDRDGHVSEEEKKKMGEKQCGRHKFHKIFKNLIFASISLTNLDSPCHECNIMSSIGLLMPEIAFKVHSLKRVRPGLKLDPVL